jgi:hypothetical protein
LKILPRRAPQKFTTFFNTFSTFAKFAKFAKFANFNFAPEHPTLPRRHVPRLGSLSQHRFDSRFPSPCTQGRVPGAGCRVPFGRGVARRGGVGVRVRWRLKMLPRLDPQKFNSFNTFAIFKSAPDTRRCVIVRRRFDPVATHLPDASPPSPCAQGRVPTQWVAGRGEGRSGPSTAPTLT